MIDVLAIVAGQSNMQGAARTVTGATRDLAVSRFTGVTDPLPGCNNVGQGGSCLPMLLDLGLARGVRYHFWNGAIGGASVMHYTGRVGGVASGTASNPAANGFTTNEAVSGGTRAAIEGESDFDPYGLLARCRAAIAARPQFDRVVFLWSNGESDVGFGTAGNYADYRGAIDSVVRYMFASGVDAALVGLSSKHDTGTVSQYQFLQLGISEVVANLRGAGLPVYAGGDLFAYYGATPPLVPELSDPSRRVHLSIRGQELHALLWNAALQAAGW